MNSADNRRSEQRERLNKDAKSRSIHVASLLEIISRSSKAGKIIRSRNPPYEPGCSAVILRDISLANRVGVLSLGNCTPYRGSAVRPKQHDTRLVHCRRILCPFFAGRITSINRSSTSWFHGKGKIHSLNKSF